MNQANRGKWGQRYKIPNGSEPDAARVLIENAHLLPVKGKALDLAFGRGGNAFFLARQGLTVAAWDISENAVSAIKIRSHIEGIEIDARAVDIMQSPPSVNSMDVIVISRFLERDLFKYLKAASRPGGLIFYQTFIAEKPDDIGPSNPDYLLKESELLKQFSNWVIHVYHEEANLGKLDSGFRNEAYLVAKKPKA